MKYIYSVKGGIITLLFFSAISFFIPGSGSVEEIKIILTISTFLFAIMVFSLGVFAEEVTDVDFEELDVNSIYRHGVKTNFCVGVAGYPEGHKECKDKTLNVKYLKEKVDAGANIIFTQMFFNANLYFDFVNDCRAAGITVPIVPGILPITFFGQIKFLENVCDVTIPDEYKEFVTNNKDDKQKIMEYSVEFITKLCEELKEKGVPGLHMYTMNNFDASQKILENLHK